MKCIISDIRLSQKDVKNYEDLNKGFRVNRNKN